MSGRVQSVGDWPNLPLDDWFEPYPTVHPWMKIVGQTCLALAPQENHWWRVTPPSRVAVTITARACCLAGPGGHHRSPR